MSEPLVILADIGGTNTRVALADGRAVRNASIAKFPNAEFASLEPVLRRYLDQAGLKGVDGVCVAAAGPVKDGVAASNPRTVAGPALTGTTRERRS